jgi:hypothetical protein
VNHSVLAVCHCLACQRRTGSVFAALAGFSAPYKVLAWPLTTFALVTKTYEKDPT